MQKRKSKAAWLLLLALLVVSSAIGQSNSAFNQRDDQYRLLGLKRAKQAYEVARSELERQQELYNRKHITDAQLDQAKGRYADAEVNYQQSLLAVLFEAQYVTVKEAIKYQAKDGRKHVRLTIANTSGGSAEFQKLINIDDELFRSLQPDVVNNVYVSMMNDQDAIITNPYEVKLDRLVYGEPQTIDFTLLQDLDEVSVYLIYANGSQRTMKIFLEKDATVDRVLVQSEQFSQEVDLGKSSSFDLTLELFSGTSNTFSLEVVNLPKQIGRFFKDRSGQVRLSQVKFTESSRTKRAAVEIALPDRPTDEVQMDTPIPFYVLIIPKDKSIDKSELASRKWTEAELDELDIGYVRLELVPRGKGELLVKATQLYYAILPGEVVKMSVDLVNEGSQRIDNIAFKTDLPLNWTKTIEPNLISSLEIGEEIRVNLTFVPSEDVSVGKYEVRLRTTGVTNNLPISGEDKSVTVELKAEANLAGSLFVVMLVLSLVGGMVYYGVRLSRR